MLLRHLPRRRVPGPPLPDVPRERRQRRRDIPRADGRRERGSGRADDLYDRGHQRSRRGQRSSRSICKTQLSVANHTIIIVSITTAIDSIAAPHCRDKPSLGPATGGRGTGLGQAGQIPPRRGAAPHHRLRPQVQYITRRPTHTRSCYVSSLTNLITSITPI